MMALTYYAPYVSGLTQAARWVAEDLAARGHQVVIATTGHEPGLPTVETVDGVEVHRAPVFLRVGKGTVSPAFPLLVRRLARRADVVNLHLPLLEAGLLARLAGGTPVVATYQCDVNLASSLLDRMQVRAVDASSRAALRRAAAVAVSSFDYARSSRVWEAAQPRAVEIAPPCLARPAGAPTFRETSGRHVGFLGRLVAEKGVEHLVDAFLRTAGPEDRLLVGGDYQRVAGGSVVEQVRARAAGDPRVRLLGFLPDEALADFYASLDVFVLPSVNSLEAFGIVQVEAMMAGVPVVASDLPGVRGPVQRTGFGHVVLPADVDALSRALVAPAPLDPAEGARRATAAYGVAATTDAYLGLFRSASR